MAKRTQEVQGKRKSMCPKRYRIDVIDSNDLKECLIKIEVPKSEMEPVPIMRPCLIFRVDSVPTVYSNYKTERSRFINTLVDYFKYGTFTLEKKVTTLVDYVSIKAHGVPESSKRKVNALSNALRVGRQDEMIYVNDELSDPMDLIKDMIEPMTTYVVANYLSSVDILARSNILSEMQVSFGRHREIFDSFGLSYSASVYVCTKYSPLYSRARTRMQYHHELLSYSDVLVENMIPGVPNFITRVKLIKDMIPVM